MSICQPDQSTSQQSLNVQQQQQQQQQSAQAQLVNQTIQTSLSVVMTPPSHEAIVKSCQNVDDPMLNDTPLTNHSLSHHHNQHASIGTISEATKSIGYHDLNSILTSSNRKCLITNLLNEQPSDLFRLVPPRLTTQQTNSMNKYKPVRLISSAPKVIVNKNKLKWRYTYS